MRWIHGRLLRMYGRLGPSECHYQLEKSDQSNTDLLLLTRDSKICHCILVVLRVSSERTSASVCVRSRGSEEVVRQCPTLPERPFHRATRCAQSRRVLPAEAQLSEQMCK